MKIEFIEEHVIGMGSGNIFYHTTVDSRFVSDSLSSDKDKAYAFFKKVVEFKGKKEIIDKKTLETVEI